MPSAPGVASFRDPAGQLIRTTDRLLRIVHASGLDDFHAFRSSETARTFMADGRLVSATPLEASEVVALRAENDLATLVPADAVTVVAHERIAFPSYPYEWPAEMLHAAGLLTLDLAASASTADFGLKDATPFNVLFRGPSPVFVDWLSFERRDPRDPTWLPYAQFVRTFLLPLLAHREFGTRLDQIFLARRDGLEPEEVYQSAGRARRLKPSMLALATLPTWLSGRADAAEAKTWQPRQMADPEKARFVLRSVFARLRRALKRLEPPAASSMWTGYMGDLSHYSQEDFGRKEAFVEAALGETRAARVLDVGCNTGHFSLLAARRGAAVVALDADAAVVGRVWRAAVAEGQDVLPLVINVARPSPATGWRNAECPSFLDRAQGGFDLVLMLAVLHHLLVTERVPLPEVLRLAADLTRDAVLLEFVAPDDPMFRRLTRGRDHLHAGLTRLGFEAACAERFEIVRRDDRGTLTRALYLLRKRS